MIPLALVHGREAVDLIVVSLVVSLGAFSWSRLRRRDAQRRIEQKERQAEYELASIRRQREWDEAQRYFGGAIR